MSITIFLLVLIGLTIGVRISKSTVISKHVNQNLYLEDIECLNMVPSTGDYVTVSQDIIYKTHINLTEQPLTLRCTYKDEYHRSINVINGCIKSKLLDNVVYHQILPSNQLQNSMGATYYYVMILCRTTVVATSCIPIHTKWHSGTFQQHSIGIYLGTDSKTHNTVLVTYTPGKDHTDYPLSAHTCQTIKFVENTDMKRIIHSLSNSSCDMNVDDLLFVADYIGQFENTDIKIYSPKCSNLITLNITLNSLLDNMTLTNVQRYVDKRFWNDDNTTTLDLCDIHGKSTAAFGTIYDMSILIYNTYMRQNDGDKIEMKDTPNSQTPFFGIPIVWSLDDISNTMNITLFKYFNIQQYDYINNINILTCLPKNMLVIAVNSEFVTQYRHHIDNISWNFRIDDQCTLVCYSTTSVTSLDINCQICIVAFDIHSYQESLTGVYSRPLIIDEISVTVSDDQST